MAPPGVFEERVASKSCGFRFHAARGPIRFASNGVSGARQQAGAPSVCRSIRATFIIYGGVLTRLAPAGVRRPVAALVQMRRGWPADSLYRYRACNRLLQIRRSVGDSMRTLRFPGTGAACCGAATTAAARFGAISKYRIETISCRKLSITSPCYLCNTRWKRGGVGLLEAVPLLPVQKSSVIVITRRRGASRGRPVLGGSLKSLAFMRECPKARSD
jgi:hypothetical protein